MNKKILLFSATLGLSYLTLTSYDDGPAKAGLNRTGAAGTTASCASGGCHGGASGTLSSAFVLKDKATSATVTDGKYVPGKTYVVTFACTTSTAGLPKFGFQAAATKADNTNGGNLTATATNTIKRTLAGIGIIEHSAPISSVLTGVYAVEFEWTAPTKGAGDITFYGIGNAVNDNGSTSGDLPGAGITAKYTETIPASIAAIAAQNQARVYPNPCSGVLNIEGFENDFSANIYDLNGRIVIANATQNSIDVSALANGAYILLLNDGANNKTASFIKQ